MPNADAAAGGGGPGPFGAAYPFVAIEPTLSGVLLDAYLGRLPAPSDDLAPFAAGGGPLAAGNPLPVTPPVRLAWAYGLDTPANGGATVAGDTSLEALAAAGSTPTHDADCRFVDAAGVVALDTTAPGVAYRGTTLGDVFVHEWRGPLGACRLVQQLVPEPGTTPGLLPRVVVPADGTLDARAYRVEPPAVWSLGGARPGPAGTARNLVVELGYNAAIAVAPPAAAAGPRPAVRLVLSLAPGGGAGRAPGCDAPPVPGSDPGAIRTIAGAAAASDVGNFLLGDDPCLPVSTPRGRPHALAVGYACRPCCDCPDYDAAAAALTAAWAPYLDASLAAASVRDGLTAAYARWRREKACREARTVQVQAVAAPPFIEIAAGVANPASVCAPETAVVVHLADEAGQPVRATHDLAVVWVDTGGGNQIRGALEVGVDGTSYRAVFPGIAPRSVATVRFRAALAGPPPARLTVTATSGGISAARTIFP